MAKTDRKGLMEELYGMIGRVWICATTANRGEKEERDQAFCGRGTCDNRVN